MLTKLAGGTCTAEVAGARQTRTTLRFESVAGRFEGQVPFVADLPAECEIVVEASAPGFTNKQRASFKIRNPNADLELLEPAAKPDVLTALATSTGGKPCASAGEVVGWIQARQTTALQAANLLHLPLWDRASILSLLLGLLVTEWFIRRILS
jgi:hypothetical protein